MKYLEISSSDLPKNSEMLNVAVAVLTESTIEISFNYMGSDYPIMVTEYDSHKAPKEAFYLVKFVFASKKYAYKFFNISEVTECLVGICNKPQIMVDEISKQFIEKYYIFK